MKIQRGGNDAPIRAWLYQDELSNRLPIADLDHLDPITILTDDPGSPRALLLVGRAAPGSWDASHFCDAWPRVIVHAEPEADVEALLAHLDPRRTYLFKCHLARIRAVIRRHFHLDHLCRLVYLTVNRARFHPVPHADVRCLPLDDPAVLHALAKSGRTDADIQRHREVQGFGIWKGKTLAACAFTMRKTQHVHEICGVYTDPAYRRRGFGAAVVSAATQALLDQGRIPCYGARTWNLPSLHLAKSLGFWYYQDVDYDVARGESGDRGF